MTESTAIRIAAADAASRDMASMTAIRTGVRENLLTVEQLAAFGITPESIAELLRTTGRAWIASIGGIDAAFAIVNAAESEVFGMFVQPGFEGRGLGRRLMAEAEAWLFAQGCTELWLSTDANPEVRAHGFYRRLGWTVDGACIGVDGEPELRYVKHRNPGFATHPADTI